MCPALRMTTEQMLLSGEADCAWLYLCWEVVRAERAAKAVREAKISAGHGELVGVAAAGMPLLRTFRLADYGIRFGYMNCITCTLETAAADGGRTVCALLDAVAEGAAIAIPLTPAVPPSPLTPAVLPCPLSHLRRLSQLQQQVTEGLARLLQTHDK